MPLRRHNPFRSVIQPCLIGLILFSGTVSAAEFDTYGGSTGFKTKASGFFRVEEIDGRWFFITPEGHPYIALGANHVGSYLQSQAEDGGLLALHGNDAEAAAEALFKSLADLGLNAGDAYQPDPRFSHRIPWVKSFHYDENGSRRPPNVFDQSALKAMAAHVSAECEKIADNPWVLGVAGPDLPRWDSSYVHPYRIAEPGSLARKGYEAFLRDRHKTITSLNETYQKTFPSWQALSEKPKLNFDVASGAAQSDEEAFLAIIAEKHFRVLREACRAGAPNHLFLGERTQLRVIPDSVLTVMGDYIDVFCTQSLIRLPKAPPEWQVFQRRHYNREFSLVKKPFIIIDWAAPFSLTQQPVETEYGTLKSEAVSGRESSRFVHEAFESPYLIGLFICQIIGTHGNDKFFTEAKRTYLKDDGTLWPTRSGELRNANLATLRTLYDFSP